MGSRNEIKKKKTEKGTSRGTFPVEAQSWRRVNAVFSHSICIRGAFIYSNCVMSLPSPTLHTHFWGGQRGHWDHWPFLMCFSTLSLCSFHSFFPPVPPRIHHISTGGHLQVKKGSSVRIECSATGNPMPNVTWSRKNNILPNGKIAHKCQDECAVAQPKKDARPNNRATRINQPKATQIKIVKSNKGRRGGENVNEYSRKRNFKQFP